MKIKGVSEAEMGIIEKILSPRFEKYDFYFYGSRCRTDFRPMSDLYILIKGTKEASFDDIESLKEEFDNSNLPYIVNLTDFHTMSDEFYKLIEKDLVPVK